MKVAICYRMSSDKQSKSIAQQLEQTRKLCRKRGYTIVHEYIDRGISGDKIKNVRSSNACLLMVKQNSSHVLFVGMLTARTF